MNIIPTLTSAQFGVFTPREPKEYRDRVVSIAKEKNLADKAANDIALMLVMCETFWDLVDSIIDMAILSKRSEFKAISRELRSLKRQFDDDIYKDAFMKKVQKHLTAPMLSYIELYSNEHGRIMKSIRNKIASMYDIDDTIQLMLSAIYFARALYAVTQRYCTNLEDAICDAIKMPRGQSIIPVYISVANGKLMRYVGGYTIDENDKLMQGVRAKIRRELESITQQPIIEYK